MKRFVSGVVLVTMACLLYVYTEVQTTKIGYAIRKQEEGKTQLLDRARALKYNIARLKSPANLEKKLVAQNVLLESPKTWQTLVLAGRPSISRRENGFVSLWSHPSMLIKFFVGTVEAQAKESLG